MRGMIGGWGVGIRKERRKERKRKGKGRKGWERKEKKRKDGIALY